MLIPPFDETPQLPKAVQDALEAEGIDVNNTDVEIILHTPPTEADIEFLENFAPEIASVEDLLRYRELRDSRLQMSACVLGAALDAKERGQDYPANQGMPTITLPASVVLEAAHVFDAYRDFLLRQLDRMIAKRSNQHNN